jgi:hypothetical protein
VVLHGGIKLIQMPYWLVCDTDINDIPTPLNTLSVMFSVDIEGNLRDDRKIGTLFKINTITQGQLEKWILTTWKRPIQRESLDWDDIA